MYIYSENIVKEALEPHFTDDLKWLLKKQNVELSNFVSQFSIKKNDFSLWEV